MILFILAFISMSSEAKGRNSQGHYEWRSISGWADECFWVESEINVRKVSESHCEQMPMEPLWDSLSGRTSECYSVDSQTKGKMRRVLKDPGYCVKGNTTFIFTSLPGSSVDCYEVDSDTLGKRMRLAVDTAKCVKDLDPNKLVNTGTAPGPDRSPAIVISGKELKKGPESYNPTTNEIPKSDSAK